MPAANEPPPGFKILPLTGAIVPVEFHFGLGLKKAKRYRRPKHKSFSPKPGRHSRSQIQKDRQHSVQHPEPDPEDELPKYPHAIRRSLLRSLRQLEAGRPKMTPYEEPATAAGDQMANLETYVRGIIQHMRAKPGILAREMAYITSLADLLNHYASASGNALREAARYCYVSDFKKPAPPKDTPVAIKKVPWRILPPGQWTFAEIESFFEQQGRHWESRADLSRLKFAKSLKPTETWIGEGEFDGYAIFRFAWTRAVLLDRPLKGHACYILKGHWKALSQLSKFELLDSHPKAVKRIFHRGEWRRRIKQHLIRSKSQRG